MDKLIVWIYFLLLGALTVYVCVIEGIRTKMAPEQTVWARIEKKYVEKGNEGEYPHFGKRYCLDLIRSDGRPFQAEVSRKKFRRYAVGDTGRLTFQRDRFVSFVKDDTYVDNKEDKERLIGMAIKTLEKNRLTDEGGRTEAEFAYFEKYRKKKRDRVRALFKIIRKKGKEVFYFKVEGSRMLLLNLDEEGYKEMVNSYYHGDDE
ncbi:MAG: DUF2500 family protein [Erysipelotrichaceae bacterium]|nr:DUF2500 family protein [Erysipelotrichaceae bacterium]MBQ1787367.1 DUF2500 family protein [Erysipelotrichaceae bacterium]MBQ5805276.1 DUF2500 family protein [Erysipelotrichaceae bacterium]